MTTTVRRAILLAVLTAGCDTGTALGICHTRSDGAESSSHCAALRLEHNDELAIWMSNPSRADRSR